MEFERDGVIEVYLKKDLTNEDYLKIGEIFKNTYYPELVITISDSRTSEEHGFGMTQRSFFKSEFNEISTYQEEVKLLNTGYDVDLYFYDVECDVNEWETWIEELMPFVDVENSSNDIAHINLDWDETQYFYIDDTAWKQTFKDRQFVCSGCSQNKEKVNCENFIICNRAFNKGLEAEAELH